MLTTSIHRLHCTSINIISSSGTSIVETNTTTKSHKKTTLIATTPNTIITTEKPKTTRKEDNYYDRTMTTEKPKTTRKEDDVFGIPIKRITTTTTTTTTSSTMTSMMTLEERFLATSATTTPATTKTGPPKGYRDGENNITDTTVIEMSTTTEHITKKKKPTFSISSSAIGSSISESSSISAVTTRRDPTRSGEDVKGGFEVRTTTTPKMKTTRIDISNEFDDYNMTTMLTTTPRYDSITFPVLMATGEEAKISNQNKFNDGFQRPLYGSSTLSTMFPVIKPHYTRFPTRYPLTVPGSTTTALPEIAFDIGHRKLETTNLTNIKSTSSIVYPMEIAGTSTSRPDTLSAIRNKTNNIHTSTDSISIVTTTDIPQQSSSFMSINYTNAKITNIPSIVRVVINTTCTDHTNCGPNQLCATGQCRLKCPDDGQSNDYACVQGITLAF